MQEINKTNGRVQNKEKYLMCGVYKNIRTLFGPLLELDNEQPDTTDMYDSESKESTDQEGQELKILTQNQMLSRLLISLIQLKAGNNSEKLKDEIRQLLYSLHKSKKLIKTIYNNLTKTI